MSKKPPGVGEHAMISQTGKNIQNLALFWQCMANAVCREQRQPQDSREFQSRLIAAFLVAAEVALQFNIHAILAKNVAHLSKMRRRFFNAVAAKQVCE